MIGIGIGLFAIGLGDVIAGGVAGMPSSRRNIVIGATAATAFAVVAALLVELGTRSFELGVFVAVFSLAWLWSRAGLGARVLPAGASLAIHGTGIAVLIAVGRRWDGGSGAVLDEVARLPLPGTAEQMLLAAGVLMWLAATANALVRLVLNAAGTQVERSQQRLRGGRVIGVIERWLIYGLAIAGQPTAAAVIVSAKSILRFPELSKAARLDLPGSPEDPAEVDIITEYFLLGSMVSWLIALMPAVLG